MARTIRFLAVALALLFAVPGWSAPQANGGRISGGITEWTITFFAGDTSESKFLDVGGQCSVRVNHSGTGTVELWQVADSSVAATSGTQVGSDFTTSTTTATTFAPGTFGVKAIATTASPDTVMKIECSRVQQVGGGGTTPFDSCRSGVRGGGFDSATGQYAWTCAGTAWTSGTTFLDCDGEASTTSGTDGRCWADGERPMVDETLEAFMLAHDATLPGGTIYVPLFAGEDHAIYVFEECDGDDCPLIQQGYSDRRKNQPNRTAYITATHGRRFVAETPCRVDPLTDRRTGVCLVDNTDDGTESGSWVFRHGLDQEARYCIPTSTTDPTCDVDAAGVAPFDMPTHALAGVSSSVDEITPSTSGNGGYGALCLDNAITSSVATTKGVCRGDPRIRCTVAGSSSRLTTTTGGCDFGAGGDLGPCEGFVDYIEHAVETLGEEHYIGLRLTNFNEDGSTASNGQQFHKLPVESVIAGTCGQGTCEGGDDAGQPCDTNGQCEGGGTCANVDEGAFVRLGIDGDEPLFRLWPYMTDEISPSGLCSGGTDAGELCYTDSHCDGGGVCEGALTVNQVDLLDQDARDMGPGYAFENFGFMPNNPLGRDSSLASADCLLGTEAACDERPLIGFMSADGGGHRSSRYIRCSEDDSKSCLDGQVPGLGAKIHDWVASDARQGLIADLSRWDFDNSLIEDTTMDGGLFAIFVSGSRVCNFTMRNVRAAYAVSGSYAKNVQICDFTLDGGYFDQGMFRLRNPVNWTIDHGQVGGLAGHFAVIGAEDETKIRGLTFSEINAFGHSAPIISSSFGPDRSKSFIAVTQSVVAADQQQGELEDIVFDAIKVESTLPEVILVHFDAGDDNAAGGATATDLGVEEYMHQVSILNSSLTSASGALVSFMNADSSSNFDAADTLDFRTASRRPRMQNNRLNGVPAEDFPYTQGAAAAFGDCEGMSYGSVVAVYDDTAIGACTDAGADGVLDGGGTAQSVCKCDPSGDSGDGAWSPM
ncbi:MAG: hypothetical protein NXI30_04535 [bacterium]|nr:hypothetical protein [bacterium]